MRSGECERSISDYTPAACTCERAMLREGMALLSTGMYESNVRNLYPDRYGETASVKARAYK